MNKEQQRIKIAEACGWGRFCTHEVNSVTVQYGHPPQSKLFYETPLPDYLNDLNAMHEAEKILNERQRQTYAWQIIRLARKQAGIDEHESHYPVPFVLFATAQQRAEAFLRTLNLWEE